MNTTTPALWTDVDYALEFEERAAIYEYDGGLPRIEAEKRAAEHVAELRRVHATAT